MKSGHVEKVRSSGDRNPENVFSLFSPPHVLKKKYMYSTMFFSLLFPPPFPPPPFHENCFMKFGMILARLSLCAYHSRPWSTSLRSWQIPLLLFFLFSFGIKDFRKLHADSTRQAAFLTEANVRLKMGSPFSLFPFFSSHSEWKRHLPPATQTRDFRRVVPFFSIFSQLLEDGSTPTSRITFCPPPPPFHPQKKSPSPCVGLIGGFFSPPFPSLS